MQKEALVIIDIQNDITKNYKEIIDGVNQAIDRAVQKGLYVIYIKHNNLSASTRTFKPDTEGSELVPELKVVSDFVFLKTKGNALTCTALADFITENGIDTFYITGADATACVKSTCYNMRKVGYEVSVLADCITSYNKKKIGEMISYYEKQGCKIIQLNDFLK